MGHIRLYICWIMGITLPLARCPEACKAYSIACTELISVPAYLPKVNAFLPQSCPISASWHNVASPQSRTASWAKSAMICGVISSLCFAACTPLTRHKGGLQRQPTTVICLMLNPFLEKQCEAAWCSIKLFFYLLLTVWFAWVSCTSTQRAKCSSALFRSRQWAEAQHLHF